MITEKAADDALHQLIDSADAFAAAQGKVSWLAESRKIIKAKLFIAEREKDCTVADAENRAYSSEEYRKAARELSEAEYHLLLIRAKREASQATLDVYRTQESSRRAGL